MRVTIMNVTRERILPYDVIQILTESDDGTITSLAWALPEDCARWWREEISVMHGEPGSEQLITSEGAREFLAAGMAAAARDEMVVMTNHDL